MILLTISTMFFGFSFSLVSLLIISLLNLLIDKIAWFTVWLFLSSSLSKLSARKDGLSYPKYPLNISLLMFFFTNSYIVNKNFT